MSREDRLMLRLAFAVVALVLLVARAAAGQGTRGARPLWLAVAVGVAVILLIAARLASRRPGGKAPHVLVWVTLKRAGRWARRIGQRVLTTVHRARRRRRVRQVELAALELAEGDDMLSPDGVRTAAEALFRLVQLAWDERDVGRLVTLLGPELLAAWEQDLAKARRSGRDERLEVVGDVRVEYVGFTTPARGQGARVVVLVEAVLRTYEEDHRGRRTDGDSRRLCQYWTLGLRDRLWWVLDIEERADGRHHLAEPIGAPAEAR